VVPTGVVSKDVEMLIRLVMVHRIVNAAQDIEPQVWNFCCYGVIIITA